MVTLLFSHSTVIFTIVYGDSHSTLRLPTNTRIRSDLRGLADFLYRYIWLAASWARIHDYNIIACDVVFVSVSAITCNSYYCKYDCLYLA